MARFQFSRSRLLNDRGFSLMEIMMVCGLVGITSLAIISLMDNVNTQMTTARIKTDALSFITSVQTTMKNSDACKYTMRNSNVVITNPTTPQAVDRIGYYNNVGDVSAMVLAPSGTSSKFPIDVPGNVMLQVKDMKLTAPGNTAAGPAPAGSTANYWVADLVISFQQKNNLNVSMKPYVIGGLQLQTNAAGQVVACHSGLSQICETAYRVKGNGSFTVSSPDPAFTGAPSDIFSTVGPAGSADPTVQSYWGLQCNPGWKMTGCSASPLGNNPAYTTSAAINGACVVTDGNSTAQTRVFLSCCSQ